MTVLHTLNTRASAINSLRTHRTPSFEIDLTATVEVTDEAVERILAMCDDLPGESIEFPSIDKWPWHHQPVLFIHAQPVELEFLITSSSTLDANSYREEDGFIDHQPVIAHWVVPPGSASSSFDAAKVVDYIGDNKGEVILAADDPQIAALLGGFGRVVAIHPNGDATSGAVPWGQGVAVNKKYPREKVSQSERFLQSLVRASLTRALLVENPVLLRRPDRRAIERTKASYQRLVVPKIGSTLPGSGKTVFRSRDHYTRFGEPKKGLTVKQAEGIVEVNPGLHAYLCPQCGQLHVGHSSS